MTWNNDRPFDATSGENGWSVGTSGNFTIVDPTSQPMIVGAPPVSPPNVGQARYPVTLPSGSGPFSSLLTLPAGLRTLYVCQHIQVSSNWTATSQATKVFFFGIGGSTGNARVYSALRGTPTMQAEIDFQAMGTTVTGSTIPQQQISWNGYPNQNQSSAVVTRAVWHRWEILLVANSPGLFDGTADWWLDGVKVGSYHAIGYSGAAETGSSNTWRYVNWNGTWGGGGISPPQEQYHWIDHVRVSGKP
jgi:hypothetical protein